MSPWKIGFGLGKHNPYGAVCRHAKRGGSDRPEFDPQIFFRSKIAARQASETARWLSAASLSGRSFRNKSSKGIAFHIHSPKGPLQVRKTNRVGWRALE